MLQKSEPFPNGSGSTDALVQANPQIFSCRPSIYVAEQHHRALKCKKSFPFSRIAFVVMAPSALCVGVELCAIEVPPAEVGLPRKICKLMVNVYFLNDHGGNT